MSNQPKQTKQNQQKKKKKQNSACPCDVCYCGPQCQCTETLCRCEASSVLNSLKKSTSTISNKSSTTTTKAATTCCGGGTTTSTSSSSCCNSSAVKNNNANNNVDNGPAEGRRYIDPLASTPTPNAANIATTELQLVGLTCINCKISVENALKYLGEGIIQVEVSLGELKNLARIEYDATKVKRRQLIDTIEAIGYDVIIDEENDKEEEEEAVIKNDDDDHDGESSLTTTTTTTKVVELTISGMTCSMCSSSVQTALSALDMVKNVNVSISTNIARVEYITTTTSSRRRRVGSDSSSGNNDNNDEIDTLKETIEDIGFDVVDTMIVDDGSGGGGDGDGDGDGEASQQDNSAAVSPDRLERLLKQQQLEVSNRKRAFLYSLIGTVPIFMVTMILPLFPSSIMKWAQFLNRTVKIGQSTFVVEALILWILATPIQFGCGYAFYRSSWYGFRNGVLGMDVLVVVGTTASYGYATWATLSGSSEYHFFETSAVLICFILLGKWMQSLAVRRTSTALTQLLELQPKTAIHVTTNVPSGDKTKNWDPKTDPYEETIVPLASIRKGDIVKVLKGSSVPADGVLKFGEMSVDESMITGESIPVLKTKGSIVLGGTICAESGREAAFVQVTGVGSKTALSQIVSLVQSAQNRQVPIQNLADQISGFFVPTVVTISVITFMVWYALCESDVVPKSWLPEDESPATFSLLFGIACLVISCPCALGLATPTAVMVGTGVGAKNGVLMKGGETLELASKVDSIVFDKTGTLTQGKAAITDYIVMVPDKEFWTKIVSQNDETGSADEKKKPALGTSDYLLWLFGSLERNSEHPLAGAIVTYAEEKLKLLGGSPEFSPPSNFIALTGRGAAGTIDDSIDVAIGNRAFCQVQGLTLSTHVETCMQRLERQGKTAIVAAVNSTPCAVMGIADELKEDAGVAISYLKNELGIDVWMVTGDNRRTARAIAKKINLPADRVIAEALPVAKVEQVEKLQEAGRIVAMVGDGVNDSPALAQADVGISMGTGAEIAAEAADMVLVRGHVSDVCTALDLSQVIFKRIQLNLLLSLVYNSLSIPLAAGVFYPWFRHRVPPTLAALAMALSSISVVCSSLALRLYKSPSLSSSITTAAQNTRRSSSRRHVIGSGNSNSSINEELAEPLLGPDPDPTERTSNLSEMEEGKSGF